MKNGWTGDDLDIQPHPSFDTADIQEPLGHVKLSEIKFVICRKVL